MLRVGLTGGIGSGKSSVAERLAALGAVVIDADLVAREVVEPGSPGLAAVAEAFGPQVLQPDGSLDRAGLGRVIFEDDRARLRLNAILHPRIEARTAELVGAVPPDAVLVHDIPLLVEYHLGSGYHLVLVVHAPAEERVRRLVDDRGMAEVEAWQRVHAQAGDDDRRAAADVWLENSGTREGLLADVDRLWNDRLVPFAANVRDGRVAPRPSLVTVTDDDPTWPAQAARLVARVAATAGDHGRGVAHIGSTAVPGLPAKDVVDLQLLVDDLDDADALAEDLSAGGFPRMPGEWWDDDSDGGWAAKRMHCAADPGRAVNLHVRVATSPAARASLLFRDWLRANDGERDAYAAVKQQAQGVGIEEYMAAKDPWIRAALIRAEAWAAERPT
jgi:dephospho-CoA kinase